MSSRRLKVKLPLLTDVVRLAPKSNRWKGQQISLDRGPVSAMSIFVLSAPEECELSESLTIEDAFCFTYPRKKAQMWRIQYHLAYSYQDQRRRHGVLRVWPTSLTRHILGIQAAPSSDHSKTRYSGRRSFRSSDCMSTSLMQHQHERHLGRAIDTARVGYGRQCLRRPLRWSG